MKMCCNAMACLRVALLAEGVDRNLDAKDDPQRLKVALLAEGVDRNKKGSRALAPFVRRPPRGGRG